MSAQSDAEAMLILDRHATGAGDAQLILLGGADESAVWSLDELETRTVLMPPGEDDVLPASATAVVSITKPGSYVLGGNVWGVSGKHGIEILTSNVSLDLNGYALNGSNTNSRHGIMSSSSVVNIRIHNGALRGWKWRGIDAGKMKGTVIEDVRVSESGSYGIILGQGRVSGCTVRKSGDDGIVVKLGRSVISDCTSELNDGAGVVCMGVSVLRDVNSTENTGHGFLIGELLNKDEKDVPAGRAGDGTIVSGCAATENGADGFRFEGFNITMESCTASRNTNDGIDVLNGGVVRGSSFYDNGYYGLKVGAAAVIESCSAFNNLRGGIAVGAGSTVRGSTSVGHSLANAFGIRAMSHSIVEGNMCHYNDIGIYILHGHCRVERNHIYYTGEIGEGIVVEGVGSIIVGNSSFIGYGGLDYVIGAGNMMGEIRTDPSSAGPWDNFDLRVPAR